MDSSDENKDNNDDESSVRVAVRIRPQLPREIMDACQICVSLTPGEPQVWLGSNKAFTYDFVFSPESAQAEVYSDTVYRLIEGTFEGYNATVLAYGQTGSGKTYTMGTAFELSTQEASYGIIPRAVKQLFEGIRIRTEAAEAANLPPPEFKVSTQFMELYNEEVIDLFDMKTSLPNISKKSGIRIHEDSNGNIYTVGVTTRTVRSKEETMSALKSGAFNRTTASTNMNDQSSRSHAIFTIHIEQQRHIPPSKSSSNLEDSNKDENTTDEGELEILTAKFHFVDLAGSERLKRTGATGDRAKEGISINCGLLALGNVISALGDTTRKVLHVPYRDSKLTRLLQDSLGGNSRTFMIACVSPSDRDFMETLNTLKYSNRARNIKNKISANQDKTSRTINLLRQEIQNLQLELMEYKQGKRIMGDDGVETTNDMYHENMMLMKENTNLRTRVKALQETVDVLTSKNVSLLAEKELTSMNFIENGEANNNNSKNGNVKKDIASMIEKYVTEIENLRTKLCESENLCAQLRKEASRAKRLSNPMANFFDSNTDVQALIEMAKKDLEKNNKEVEKVRRISSVTVKDEDADSDDQDDITVTGNDDDNSSDDDTDTEESENHDEELVELTSEISLKQKLIEELETSQKRLHIMKQQYENKLISLQNRIYATEEERDKVLKNMSPAIGTKSPGQNADKVTRIKEEYKSKLEKLQGEVKKLQAAKKEHAKLLRNQSQYERQLDKLKSDVIDMKRSKVKLVQKMKEESNRHRELENRRNRELSQMKKTSRKNESRIRTLESEKRMKDVVLKRKTEEVNSLRRNARRISQMQTMSSKHKMKFSIKYAKNKWHSIEKQIMKVALNRQAVSRLENDMERWLKEREKLSHKLDKMSLKRKRIAHEKGEESTLVEDLDDQIENLRANLSYLHDNIVECQQTIVQMEQAEDPEDEDEGGVTKIINITELQLDEAKYLMEKLLSMTISQSCLATQKDGAVREIENRMAQALKQNSLHQQLLQHMIEQQDLEVYDLMLLNEQGDSESESDNESNIFVSNSSEQQSSVLPNNVTSEFMSEDNGSDSSMGRREKARRKMTTKEDLLFNDTDVPISPKAELITNVQNTFSRSLSFTKGAGLNTELMSRSRSFIKPDNNRYNIMSSSMDQSAFSRLAPVYQPSPVLGRRSLDRHQIQRKASPKSTRKFSSTLRLNDQESPPGSPPSFRRIHRDSDPSISGGRNVFNRLLAGTSIGQPSKLPEKGTIIPFQGRIGPKSPLICCNVAEGHSKAVLSVYATDEYLFSGSKDRTVKVWDLCRKEEVQSLSGHPNNVVCVKYSKQTRLAFTVSSAFIKVWDLRMSTAICIKTLSSSGLTTNGPVQINSTNRTLAMPPGETSINDIALGESGYDLYSAAADKVRMWDLRKFHSIGKLSGGHQAAVMCLETEGSLVATGSKDHYIKVFDVSDKQGVVIAPCMNLTPPHYDGIQCLAMSGDSLFSASRDFCIKKWDLKNQEIVKSVNNAHKDWICGLAFLPDSPIVVSGCRAGILKLWSADSLSLIGEMKAHNSTINTITTNNQHVFTGSNDGSIGVWRIRNNYDKSPDSESS
ncbi:LOW QUALITY PROTEIN: kinesin-like protein KIF21A [Lepeophtheirus salmonis]|uniref:LOW QUALITY PROTEIN: kinesin-like protein KIF21A n=1 Tax=Lepeophtheirus salmonis TaxID=72036 RepID=UPI003AF35BFF